MATLTSGQWNYAVPLDDTDDYAGAQRARMDSQGKGVRAASRQNSAWDAPSDTETGRSRGTSGRSNNASAGRKRSRNALREKQDPRGDKLDEAVDDSAWIHRDKLVQIEIQEMEAAGYYVPQSRRSTSAGPSAERTTSRSASRTGARRTSNYTEQGYDEDPTAAQSGYDDPGRERKRISTIPAADEEDHEYEQTPYSEYATPLEGGHPDHSYESPQHSSRPNTSRIPISARSPVPVPQNVVSRDLPLPRSRSGSGAVGTEWQSADRTRSYSASSQVLGDAQDQPLATPTGSSKEFSNSENSPSKSRPGAKGTPTKQNPNGIPRPGSSSNQNKGRQRSVSKPSAPNGPNKSRPSTSHGPPEGEAPWITGMYKPDPRLPPDQQILPTHMKRMMQEQWEREGRTGTVYDRELNLLNDTQLEMPKVPSPTDSYKRSPADDLPRPSLQAAESFPSEPKRSADENLPLPHSLSPQGDHRSESGSIRQGNSGGYRITPTIPSTPQIVRSPVPSTAMAQPPRVPELDEKEEAKPKKMCCCVMM